MNANKKPLPDTTLGRHIAQFLLLKQRAWRPKTERLYRLVLTGLVSATGDIWPVTFAEVMAYLNSTKANTTSLHSYFGHLRTFFNYLELTNVITAVENPIRQINQLRLLPRADDLPPVALHQREVGLFFDCLAQQAERGEIMALRDLAMFRLAYITGCRAGELARLKWVDIKLDGLSATIYKTKSHKLRVVYFNAQVRTDLCRYRDRLKFLGFRCTPVFLAFRHCSVGRPLTASGIYQAWKRRLKAAGLKAVKLHALRHTSANHAIDRGISIYQVKDQLGHASIKTTCRYLNGRDETRADRYGQF